MNYGTSAHESIEKCPVCGLNKLHKNEVIYDVPLLGQVVIFSCYCEACGYRHMDIVSMELKGGRRISYVVEDEEDIYAKIVRAPTATIKVPELGTTIRPGPAAQAFITNVEGLMERIRDAIEMAIRWSESDEEKKQGLAYLKKIEEILNGNEKATIIIEDPLGNSFIIPPKGREKKLKIEYMEY